MRRLGFTVLGLFCLLIMAAVPVSCVTTSYELSESSVPALGGTLNPPGDSYDVNTTVDVTARPTPGYRFDHWEGDASGTSATVRIVMTSNKKLVAHFIRIYTLTVSYNPADGGAIAPINYVYDESSQATLTAVPARGFRFDHWGGDVSGTSSNVSITMDSNKTVVVYFTRLTYTLSVTVSPPGGGSVNPVSGTFVFASEVLLTASPAPGYRFVRWGGSGSGTSTYLSLPIDDNKSVIAYFVKVWYLTIEINPPGAGTVSPFGGPYDAGTPVTLTATAGFPYAFQNWSATNDDIANPTSVTINSDITVTANFRRLVTGYPYPVTTSGSVSRVPLSIAEFELSAGEWVEGRLLVGPVDIAAQIVDASNNVLKDLGRFLESSFTFQAQVGGNYRLVIYRSYSTSTESYTLTYTVY